MHIFISFYVVNQYHTKSAISVFKPLSYYNTLINTNLITTAKYCRIM